MNGDEVDVGVGQVEDDGPACDTCGRTGCPDADLPEFSEPLRCEFVPIYHALKDAKDCDYGCSRDYTNQAIRFWVVEAVEKIFAARSAAATTPATPPEGASL